MKTVFGNTLGLKASHLRQLENLYRRRVRPEQIISPELARDLARLSHESGRQIGLLISRLGRVAYVMAGDQQRIEIPRPESYRAAPGRLMGLRCVHTHLQADEPLSADDLTDLTLLRLDLMAVLTVRDDGAPHRLLAAHILPGATAGDPFRRMEPLDPHHPHADCLELIQALESEMALERRPRAAGTRWERAMLVSVSTSGRREALDSLAELKELARSCGVEVIDTLLQQRPRVDPRFLMGSGKLRDLAVTAAQREASLIVFDQELNASQIRSITDAIQLKVIDRTQLILDIFAQRARSREGKLQVELAQLKYLLPRLVTKNTAMSRLTGGIGGRGPGETKLEINRRRARERIGRLEDALRDVQRQRQQQRSRRQKQRLPVISIVGYTNAGKSTLLNTLTKSRVAAENRLFATLDPSSRRLRFPRDVEVIITDTVGFIRDLPRELQVAFRATLEELEQAHILLHVIDASNPRCEEQVEAVEGILTDLNLEGIHTLRVLNKVDLLDAEARTQRLQRLGGFLISAVQAEGLEPLIAAIQDHLLGGLKV
jgi:GTP-binding protein HflX